MRRPVIAGNWKMYKTQAETRAFFEAFQARSSPRPHCDIVVAPPFTALDTAAAEAAKGTPSRSPPRTCIGSREGAFTGEISSRMLVEIGCSSVIIGHSERRQYFNETDESVHRKTKGRARSRPYADRVRRRSS